MAKELNVKDDMSAEAVVAVLDAMLLAIIHAHPLNGDRANAYARLRAAKKALFDLDPPEGRPKDNDLPEMLYMAEAIIPARKHTRFGEDYELILDSADKLPALQVIARKALQKKKRRNPKATKQSENKERNLVRKFNEHMPYWLKMSNHAYDMQQHVFELKIRELAELLHPLGLEINQEFWKEP